MIALPAILAAPAAANGAGLRVTSTVQVTRADGTAVAVPLDFRVWCGRWERDVPVRALQVRVGTPPSLWRLSAVVRDVRRRPVVRFPRFLVWNKPKGALLFAVDGENETSSAAEEAAGRIAFDRVRCGRRLAVPARMEELRVRRLGDARPPAASARRARRPRREGRSTDRAPRTSERLPSTVNRRPLAKDAVRDPGREA